MPQVLVVKLGTNLVTDAAGRANAALLASIAQQVRSLWDEGRRVAIVSSGAVGAGLSLLGLKARPRELSDLQAVAAAGQPVLMQAWEAAFSRVGLHVGQVLITREDADDRGRFLNFRNTVAALWRLGAVPIINENDTVSTDELRSRRLSGAGSFGDNDRLAAIATSALSAEMLVLLSTVPGLMDGEGQVVAEITSIDEASSLLRDEKSPGGTGGMPSKLAAARHVLHAGEVMVLADGRETEVLLRIARGEAVGTRFVPGKVGKLLGRSRWIAGARASGRLTLDAGAVRAVMERGASLLPAGVTAISGQFEPGDVVELADETGHVVARGLVNYPSAIASRIRGKRTAELGELLGAAFHEELVHRDQLVVVAEGIEAQRHGGTNGR